MDDERFQFMRLTDLNMGVSIGAEETLNIYCVKDAVLYDWGKYYSWDPCRVMVLAAVSK